MRSNAAHTRAIAGDRPRAHQRLVLPHPRVVVLILLERGERTHHRAGPTGRTQARVDVVQRAGMRARGEHVQQTPHHAVQETVVLRVEVVQEHDVEVGARAQFETAEFAEADDRERLRRRPRSSPTVRFHASCSASCRITSARNVR